MEDTGYYNYPPTAFPPNVRVELHPASDLWMSGARFGTVVKAYRTRVSVRLDNGRTVMLRTGLIKPTDDAS